VIYVTVNPFAVFTYNVLFQLYVIKLKMLFEYYMMVLLFIRLRYVFDIVTLVEYRANITIYGVC